MGNADLNKTMEAARLHGWTIVRLEPGTKRLIKGSTWEECATKDPRLIRAHLEEGGGIGLDVFASGMVVFDIDVPEAYMEMFRYYPLPPPTITSPSGGLHVYFKRPEHDLPALLNWEGKRVGEIIRGPKQQVVMPPSPYPGNSKRKIPAGGYYTWKSDWKELHDIPDAWLEYFEVPEYITVGDTRGVNENLEVILVETRLARARQQRGAKQRSFGIKFQCPACRAEGHDKSMDNAVVFNDGRWACAHSPGNMEHRRAIARALDISESQQEIEEHDEVQEQMGHPDLDQDFTEKAGGKILGE